MSDKVQIDQQPAPLVVEQTAPPLALILIELRRIARLLEIIADEHVEAEDVETDIDM
jgi:hypothetical protein